MGLTRRVLVFQPRLHDVQALGPHRSGQAIVCTESRQVGEKDRGCVVWGSVLCCLEN